MRAPPLVTIATAGRPRFAARSSASVTFSPTAQPIVPPMNPKSRTISITGAPPIDAIPVSTASVSPVLRWSWNMLLLYELVDVNDMGSSEISDLPISLKLLGSARESMRSFALML